MSTVSVFASYAPCKIVWREVSRQLQSHTRILPLIPSLESFNAWSRAVLLQTERRKNIIVLAQCRRRAVDVMCMRRSRDSLLSAFHSWTLFIQFRGSLRLVHQKHIKQRHIASLTTAKRVFFGKMLLALRQTRRSRSLALARAMSHARNMVRRAYDAWLRLSRMYRWRRHKIAALMNANRMATLTTVFEDWVAEKQRSARVMQQERGRSKLQYQVMHLNLKHQMFLEIIGTEFPALFVLMSRLGDTQPGGAHALQTHAVRCSGEG
jgi:hypothetical protein